MTEENIMTTKTTPNARERAGGGAVVRYAGQCLGCKKYVEAQTRKQWQRATRSPCPHCGRKAALS